MPAAAPAASIDDLLRLVEDEVFGGADDLEAVEACGRDGVGIELEFLTGTPGFGRVPLSRLRALQDSLTLPGGSAITIEPGGQLELSSPCRPDLHQACETMATDLFSLDQACQADGLELVALGADPVRLPERVVVEPRYRAMERYFDRFSPAGRTMMCNTAAIQINLGLGHGEQTQRRWRAANALGPTFIAAFANSPFARGVPTGWQSTRLRSWWALDPSRSAPVPVDGDPAARWLEYALDARVMLIRAGRNEYVAPAEPLTFRRWIGEGHRLGWPTLDDFAYHLTTLFPPVRPKGWFELRMFDALPTPFWHVAAAVAYALVTDDGASEAAREVTAGTAGLWIDAAQLGLAHPDLAASARRCFAIALDALEALPVDDATRDLVAAYEDRWVARGRCPGDDRLDAWRATGTLMPPARSPIPYADFPLEAHR